MLTRRFFLAGSAPFALVACGIAGATTPAQVVADVQGIITGLQQAAPLAFQFAPALLPSGAQATITQDLALAAQFARGLSSGLPAVQGASTVQGIEGYLNDVVSGLAAITPAAAAVLPVLAPAVGVIEAAAVLLPALEAFVNGALPQAAGTVRTSTGTRAAAIANNQGLSLAQAQAAARLALHIPVVQ